MQPKSTARPSPSLSPTQATFQFKPRDLFHPRERVADFLRRLAVPAPVKVSDRRAEPRYLLSTEMTVVPVNEELDPVGDGSVVMMRDVSLSGASFYSGHPISSKYLVLHLVTHEGEQMNALLDPVRCCEQGGIYVIGGKFVTKLYRDGARVSNDSSGPPHSSS